MRNLPKATITLYACVLLLFVIRGLFPLYGQLFNPDKLEQIVAAHNWVSGNGISRMYVTAESPITPLTEALIQWPPGYSYFLGMLRMVGFNLFQSLAIVDITLLILLGWAAFVWLQNMSLPNHWICLLLWTLFMFNTSMIERTTTVDLLCFTLFFTALVLLYKPGEKQTILNAGFAGILLGLTCWIRYAYIPQTIALIGIGALYDFIFNKARVYRVWAPVILSSSILLLIYFLRGSIQNPGYIDENTAGIYFNNLKRFNTEVIGEALLGSAGFQRILVRFGTWPGILLGSLISLAACLLLYLAYKANALKGLPIFVAFSIIAINIGMLIYLSLTNAPQTWTANGWTFVEAHRYYAPTWAVVWLSMMSAAPYLMKYKYSIGLLVGLCLFTVIDFSYYTKWKLAHISFSEIPSMHLLPHFQAYQEEAQKLRDMGKLPVYSSKDAYSGLIAEAAGWIQLKDELISFPFVSQEVALLAIQYPTDQLPAQWVWKKKQMDSGTSVYLTNNQ